MLIPLKNKIWSGYFIAFLLLALSYSLIFFIIEKLDNEADRVEHSYNVINRLERLKAGITDAETGFRGYAISKDKRFLEPYNTSIGAIPDIYKELKELVSDNDIQLQKLDTLHVLTVRRLGFISNGLKLFEANGLKTTDQMIIAREPSKNAMDSIRLFVNQMKGREETLMTERKNKLSKFFASMVAIAISSLVIALVTLFYSLITFNRENKAREKADRQSRQYRTELETSINELKQMNIELQELKSQEKFAATGRIARTIAHEVRNPLTNISLALEQLQEFVNQNADSSVLLDMINRNSSRINQLVSDLLNATRFVQLAFIKTDINQLMEETLDLAKDRIELNHIKVEKYFAKDLCNVSVDVEKMKLALLNIIVNAIEAMEKDKGVLTLITKRQDKKCMIEIKDNGTGMDEDTQQKLFEAYFTNKLKGNGLGLTHTQNIILNHGGSIKVYSKPGQGSTFTVILDQA